MWRLAVIGPTATRGLGLARACAECRESAGSTPPACTGFGSGCLGYAAPEPEEVAKAREALSRWAG